MKNRILLQTVVCLVLFAAVNSTAVPRLGEKYDKFGWILEQINDAIVKNYTLAELLDMGLEAASEAVSLPVKVGEAVIQVNEQGLYGQPVDRPDEDEGGVMQVYAAAGGRVIRSGINSALGMYVMIEHPASGFREGKISTYGHLSDLRAVEGERVNKGDIIGSYDSSCGQEFYYVLEEKCG